MKFCIAVTTVLMMGSICPIHTMMSHKRNVGQTGNNNGAKKRRAEPSMHTYLNTAYNSGPKYGNTENINILSYARNNEIQVGIIPKPNDDPHILTHIANTIVAIPPQLEESTTVCQLHASIQNLEIALKNLLNAQRNSGNAVGGEAISVKKRAYDEAVSKRAKATGLGTQIIDNCENEVIKAKAKPLSIYRTEEVNRCIAAHRFAIERLKMDLKDCDWSVAKLKGEYEAAKHNQKKFLDVESRMRTEYEMAFKAAIEKRNIYLNETSKNMIRVKVSREEKQFLQQLLNNLDTILRSAYGDIDVSKQIFPHT